MSSQSTAAIAAALLVALGSVPAHAQNIEPVGPVLPEAVAAPENGPLPAELSLRQALIEAERRSPDLAAARAEIAAAQGRLDQAGLRYNPQFSVELENFGGSGALRGFRTTETTVSVNQQIDLAGHRRARVTLGEARLFAQQLRYAITRADLIADVRRLFAAALAAREQLTLARDNVERATELARVARELVDAGREPPLRGLRAQAALARATATLRSAEAEEVEARRSLATRLGATNPPERLTGDATTPIPTTIVANATLDVQLAQAERAITEAELGQARAEGRVDPSLGIGVRHVRETGDVGLVAGFSMPLPIFNRNQGNVAAAQSGIDAADARLAAQRNESRTQIANARSDLAAAEARLQALEGSGLGEAREALRLAQISYRAGKASLLELLDAQQAYALTQSELIDARRARAEAEARLARQAATAQ